MAYANFPNAILRDSASLRIVCVSYGLNSMSSAWFMATDLGRSVWLKGS